MTLDDCIKIPSVILLSFNFCNKSKEIFSLFSKILVTTWDMDYNKAYEFYGSVPSDYQNLASKTKCLLR